MLRGDVSGSAKASEKGLWKEFDKVLLESLEEGLRQVLGGEASKVILLYLEKHKGLKREEILHNIEELSPCLTELLGSSATQILERIVIKILCSKLQLEYDDNPKFRFSEHVQKLRELKGEVT